MVISNIIKRLSRTTATGGHSPRGNAICERVNQSIGSMIRKLSDHEYKNLSTLYLPSFQLAINTTFNSVIGCTPFEAGHGLLATTITQARARLNGVTPIDVGGYEHEDDEEIDEFFDKDSLKLQKKGRLSTRKGKETTLIRAYGKKRWRYQQT